MCSWLSALLCCPDTGKWGRYSETCMHVYIFSSCLVLNLRRTWQVWGRIPRTHLDSLQLKNEWQQPWPLGEEGRKSFHTSSCCPSTDEHTNQPFCSPQVADPWKEWVELLKKLALTVFNKQNDWLSADNSWLFGDQTVDRFNYKQQLFTAEPAFLSR